MKIILLIIYTAIFCFNLNASDTITLKNRKVIHAYIIEKSDTKIKYRTDSITNLDSTYTLKLTQIKTIQYNNGKVDLLSFQNPRSIFPLGVNVGFTSISMFLGSVDYFITPNISTELNFKYIPSYNFQNIFSFGGKYWFANKYGKSGFSPFAGLFFAQIRARNDYEDIKWYNAPKWSVFNYMELPLGISYITKFGLQTSLQLDSYIGYESDKLNIVSGLIELRIGWRF